MSRSQGGGGGRDQASGIRHLFVAAPTQLIRLVYVYMPRRGRAISSDKAVFYIMNLHALRIS